jgi:hypothetical protein
MPERSCLKKDLLVLKITYQSDRELDEIKKIIIKKIIEAERSMNKKIGISKVILNLGQQESFEHLTSQVDCNKKNFKEDVSSELFINLVKESIDLDTLIRKLHRSRYDSINQMIREAHESLMAVIEKLAIVIGDNNNSKIADGGENVTIH